MHPKAEGKSVFKQYCKTLEARRPLLFENTIVDGTHERPMTETSLCLLFLDSEFDVRY